MSDVPAILTIIGGILLLLSILGGGLTIKEMTVPVVPTRIRVVLLPAGLIFLGLGIWLFLPDSVRSFGREASPASAPTAAGAVAAVAQPTNAPAPTTAPTRAPAGAAVVQELYGFEGPTTLWMSPDDRGSTMQCEVDTAMAHSGGGSARIRLDLAPNGWGDCWVEDSALRDWSHGGGLSLWVRADRPGTMLTVWIQFGSVENRSAFEAGITLPPEAVNAWSQLTLPWSDLTRYPLAEADDLYVFDPSTVVLLGYMVTMPSGEGEVSIWIDDVALVAE